MKFSLKIEKTVEIDTDRDWDGDLQTLYEKLEAKGYEPGEEVDKSAIIGALSDMFDEDIESIGNFPINSSDVSITFFEEPQLVMPVGDE